MTWKWQKKAYNVYPSVFPMTSRDKRVRQISGGCASHFFSHFFSKFSSLHFCAFLSLFGAGFWTLLLFFLQFFSIFWKLWFFPTRHFSHNFLIWWHDFFKFGQLVPFLASQIFFLGMFPRSTYFFAHFCMFFFSSPGWRIPPYTWQKKILNSDWTPNITKIVYRIKRFTEQFLLQIFIVVFV